MTQIPPASRRQSAQRRGMPPPRKKKKSRAGTIVALAACAAALVLLVLVCPWEPVSHAMYSVGSPRMAPPRWARSPTPMTACASAS